MDDWIFIKFCVSVPGSIVKWTSDYDPDQFILLDHIIEFHFNIGLDCKNRFIAIISVVPDNCVHFTTRNGRI